jgi:hypothetical protein
MKKTTEQMMSYLVVVVDDVAVAVVEVVVDAQFVASGATQSFAPWESALASGPLVRCETRRRSSEGWVEEKAADMMMMMVMWMMRMELGVMETKARTSTKKKLNHG